MPMLSDITSPAPAGRGQKFVQSYKTGIPLAPQLCRPLMRSQSTYPYEFVKASVGQFSKNTSSKSADPALVLVTQEDGTTWPFEP